MLNGVIDRSVWIRSDEKIVAADILDFKTNTIRANDMQTPRERTEFYRPQMEAYRKTTARLGKLKDDCVSARLVFADCGAVVPM